MSSDPYSNFEPFRRQSGATISLRSSLPMKRPTLPEPRTHLKPQKQLSKSVQFIASSKPKKTEVDPLRRKLSSFFGSHSTDFSYNNRSASCSKVMLKSQIKYFKRKYGEQLPNRTRA